MIEIKVISDFEEAKKLWNLLSPQEIIYDLWDFRYCFYKYEICPLNFIAAYDEKEPVALFALQYNEKDKCLESFAEEFMEESRPFIKPGYEYLIPELYKKIIGRTRLLDLTENSETDEFTKAIPVEDYIYLLPLEKYQDFPDFLSDRLNAKRRRSLVKELAEVAKKNLSVEIYNKTELNKDKLDVIAGQLFDFNILSFADDSYLQTEAEKKAHRDLFDLDLDWRLIILSIDGQREAISFSIIYNNIWFYVITGVNFKKIPGLGKYLVKVNIEEAIKEGVKVYDCGLGDCGWKNLWHFDKKAQHIFSQE